MAKHEAKPAVEPAGRRIKRGVANEDSSSLREAVVTVPAAAYQQKGDRQEPPAFMVERGLVPLPGQGETVQYRGILGRTGIFFSRNPTGFRLVRIEGRRKIPVCFVMGNEEQLSWLVGSTLAVTGREYWLKGEKHPVVVLERILVTDRKAKTER